MSARRKTPSTPSTPHIYTEPILNGTPTPSSTNMRNNPPRTPASALFPTRLETLLISLYPGTLLLGSIFSTLSPTTRHAPYSATLQSHPPDFAPSYFAQKRNIFNVFFVKQGWAWTTAALVLFLLTHPSLGPPMRPVLTPRRCELIKDPGAREEMSNTREYVTAAGCKLVGGQWKGGYDISGHVFLLTLGSALLWFEILPAVSRAEGLRDGRRVVMSDGKVRTAASEAQRESHGVEGEAEEGPGLGMKVALGVMGMMWWMLLMTAAFFHTWFEKWTALVVAFTGLWAVYFLPRAVPAMRAIVGMPGV
ncbi:hypothetical protein H2199_007542 [Coniosporium tulheliwenetii]|uniref:Uncharacterized protein n=1 Tax=Coniosporium tulheliwenetii TaxID=3383036 RepID=A0ACC2YPH5_9PEZI|nr:hypothetical protein H2199_007542 [Cladosporium sp. JES 115]